MFHLKKICCLLILLVVAALPAAADLTIVSKVTNDKNSGTATTYISETQFRRVDAESDVIFNIESGTITSVDHKKKKYSTTSLKELEAKMQELTAMLEGNPMVSQMLGDIMGSAEVTKVGDTRTVAGYDCVLYRVSVGKNISMDLWVASDLKPPVSHYDARKMFYVQMGPLGGQFEKMIDEMKKIGGYSLASTTRANFMGRQTTTQEEATEVKEGDLPASTFEVPAGYKQGKPAF